MRKKNSVKGTLAVAFGVGLLFASFLPAQCLVILLAIAVIVLGISCSSNNKC